MARRPVDSDHSAPIPDQTAQTGHNPRGAARRRLLRAIGKSGGLAIGSLLAANWVKPVVKSVMLPAHAQTSLGGCPIEVFGSVQPSSSAPFSLSVVVGNTVLNSVSGSISSTSLSGSGSFPPGSYAAGLVISQGSTQGLALTELVSCCGASNGAMGGVFNTTAAIVHLVTISDDGECTVSGIG